MAAKLKQTTALTVYSHDENEYAHELANNTDWAVIFDDVLEVKTTAGTFYYPLHSILKWVVK